MKSIHPHYNYNQQKVDHGINMYCLDFIFWLYKVINFIHTCNVKEYFTKNINT